MNDYKSYLTSLDQWMEYYGFENVPLQEGLEVDRMYRRSRVEATKFGKVDCYSFIKHVPDETGAEYAKSYSDGLFNYAYSHRSGGAPLGFGAMLVVYPVLVVNNISNVLYEFSKHYCPKHFSATEFPSVLNLSSGDVYYYPTTPVWGYAYYANYRRESQRYFSPNAWRQTSGGEQ